jgi:putative FmdB family regulatory protein
MPIYEYACKACEHQFEEWQKINDPPVRKCPACGKRRVERLLSLSSFQLKGGGWYADGYASTKNGKGEASKGNGASGKGEGTTTDAPKATDAAKSDKPKAKAAEKAKSTSAASAA